MAWVTAGDDDRSARDREPREKNLMFVEWYTTAPCNRMVQETRQKGWVEHAGIDKVVAE